MATTWNITASSIPDLDDWGWDEYWSCPEWMKWHQLMTQSYGVAAANEKFLQEWNKQSMGAHALDCRSFNSEFRSYTQSVGLHDALYNGALLAKPLGVVTDGVTAASEAASSVVQSAGEAVSGIAGGIGSFGKSLKYLIPVVLIVAVAIVGMVIYKRTQKLAA